MLDHIVTTILLATISMIIPTPNTKTGERHNKSVSSGFRIAMEVLGVLLQVVMSGGLLWLIAAATQAFNVSDGINRLTEWSEKADCTIASLERRIEQVNEGVQETKANTPYLIFEHEEITGKIPIEYVWHQIKYYPSSVKEDYYYSAPFLQRELIVDGNPYFYVSDFDKIIWRKHSGLEQQLVRPQDRPVLEKLMEYRDRLGEYDCILKYVKIKRSIVERMLDAFHAQREKSYGSQLLHRLKLDSISTDKYTAVINRGNEEQFAISPEPVFVNRTPHALFMLKLQYKNISEV